MRTARLKHSLKIGDGWRDGTSRTEEGEQNHLFWLTVAFHINISTLYPAELVDSSAIYCAIKIAKLRLPSLKNIIGRFSILYISVLG